MTDGKFLDVFIDGLRGTRYRLYIKDNGEVKLVGVTPPLTVTPDDDRPIKPSIIFGRRFRGFAWGQPMTWTPPS